MCNFISGPEYSNYLRLNNFCCFFSVKTGTLFIGWVNLIGSLAWIIGLVTNYGKYEDFKYLVIVNYTIDILSGIFLLRGVYSDKVRLIWSVVYIKFFLLLWSITATSLFFAFSLYFEAFYTLITDVLFLLYFVLVIRSYAYEAETGPLPI